MLKSLTDSGRNFVILYHTGVLIKTFLRLTGTGPVSKQEFSITIMWGFFTLGRVTLRDLKRCRMAHVFYNTFFNLEKYLDNEQRDPFAVQKV